MMFKSTVLALALSAMTSVAALANDAGPIGAGDSLCSEYLAKAKAPAAADIYAQWASGLITGIVSRSTQIDPPGLTLEKVAAGLRAYCTAHPKESLFVAAGTLAAPYTVARR